MAKAYHCSAFRASIAPLPPLVVHSRPPLPILPLASNHCRGCHGLSFAFGAVTTPRFAPVALAGSNSILSCGSACGTRFDLWSRCKWRA